MDDWVLFECGIADTLGLFKGSFVLPSLSRLDMSRNRTIAVDRIDGVMAFTLPLCILHEFKPIT